MDLWKTCFDFVSVCWSREPFKKTKTKTSLTGQSRDHCERSFFLPFAQRASCFRHRTSIEFQCSRSNQDSKCHAEHLPKQRLFLDKQHHGIHTHLQEFHMCRMLPHRKIQYVPKTTCFLGKMQQFTKLNRTNALRLSSINTFQWSIKAKRWNRVHPTNFQMDDDGCTWLGISKS